MELLILLFLIFKKNVVMSSSTKQKKEETRMPPEGLGNVDHQRDSSTCVRFALSKAVATSLFLNHKIDIAQESIAMCLVQEHKNLHNHNPLEATDPMIFDKTTLYLQDVGNGISGLPDKGCWWKVTLQYIIILNICSLKSPFSRAH